MKIAVNTRILLEGRMEGIARFSYEVCKRLALQHPDDVFYFFFDRAYSPKFVFGANVIPVVLSPQARHPVLWWYWFEVAISKAMEKYNIDVFFSPESYISLKSKIPAVMVTHDLAYVHYPDHLKWSHQLYSKKYWPSFHQKAAHIIAVSQTTKDDIVKEYHINQDKITVATNHCSEHFRPISNEKKLSIRDKYSNGLPFFMYLGSMHPRKNVSNLVKAFDVFCETNEDHQLLLVGRWAWKTGDIAHTIQESPFRSRIHIYPKLDDEIPTVLAASEALTYVSLWEGFGIPLLEAMHCDVPVITSNLSSMPEVVGDAALLVNPNDPKEIAKAMTNISSNIELRNDLIQKGKKQRQKYSWEKTSQIIYKILKKAANL